MAVGGEFEYAGILEDAGAFFGEGIANGGIGSLFGEGGAGVQGDFPDPEVMLVEGRITGGGDGDIEVTSEIGGEGIEFGEEATGKDEQTHDLNEADIFFFDMVQISVGMKEAQGVLIGGAVVAQDEVEAIDAVLFAKGGGDGVVGLIGVGDDVCVEVGVCAPGGEHGFGEIEERLFVLAAQADAAQGPVDDFGLNAVDGCAKGGEGGSLVHGEGVATTLKVVMVEDRAADDGEVGIGADEVVREEIDEGEHVLHVGAVDVHGDMVVVEEDAVLLIVEIRGILEEPGVFVEGEGDHAVILAGRETGAARIAGIVDTEHAGGIGKAGGIFERGDVAGIFFRLGEVDGDVQIAIGGGGGEALIFGDLVDADVIAVAAELIEPVGGSGGAFGMIAHEELVANGAWGRGDEAAEPGTEALALVEGVADEADGGGMVAQGGKDGGKGLGEGIIGRFARFGGTEG